jgi:hypothetical protein
LADLVCSQSPSLIPKEVSQTAQKQDVERLLGKCREKLAEIAMLMPMQPELSLDLGEVKMALD